MGHKTTCLSTKRVTSDLKESLAAKFPHSFCTTFTTGQHWGNLSLALPALHSEF